MKSILPPLGLLAALVTLSFALPVARTRPTQARRVLEDSGYTNIEMTGWRPFAKSEKDVFSTGFEATAPSGRRVTGAVTSGWLKGATIRLD